MPMDKVKVVEDKTFDMANDKTFRLFPYSMVPFNEIFTIGNWVENYSFRFEIEWVRIDKDVVQIVYFKTDITKHKIKWFGLCNWCSTLCKMIIVTQL